MSSSAQLADVRVPASPGSKGAVRTVVLVAPHFVPSNLAAVHRARLFAQHLGEFGWRPIILTTHWRHYEEAIDPGLAALVDPSVEVVRTKALPTHPVRLVGDIGVRALPWHLRALRALRRERQIDFVHITVPSFFSAALGPILYREAPLAYGIDYIDPWVHLWPEAEVKFSKAWMSYSLGARLEPWCVRNASLITGVSAGYYEGVLQRNPHLRESCVTAAMPYGFSIADFQARALDALAPTEFDPDDGLTHLVYAGALLPKAHAPLRRLLEGVALLRAGGDEAGKRIRLHFIGTGKTPTDPSGYNVLPVAQTLGLSGVVTEHPHRMAYLHVLAHLKRATSVLIVGSTEAHYTPSKVFQAVQSRRPVLAVLHKASTAVDVLTRSGAGQAITMSETEIPSAPEMAARLRAFITAANYAPENVRWAEFETYSARESSRLLAAGLEEAIGRFEAREAR